MSPSFLSSPDKLCSLQESRELAEGRAGSLCWPPVRPTEFQARELPRPADVFLVTSACQLCRGQGLPGGGAGCGSWQGHGLAIRDKESRGPRGWGNMMAQILIRLVTCLLSSWPGNRRGSILPSVASSPLPALLPPSRPP